MSAASRISRWTGSEQRHRAPEPLLHIKQVRSGVSDRAEAALEVALNALSAASEELRRSRVHRRKSAVVEIVIESIGLVGLIGTALFGTPETNLPPVCLFAVVGAVPIGMSIRRLFLGQSRESEIVAAVENARVVALNATFLRDAVAGLPAQDVGHPSAGALMKLFLTSVEQSAAVASGRELPSQETSVEQSRRHERIKPINDRVTVTRSDGVAIIVEVVDVSLSGVALRGDLPDVGVGDHVLVGSKDACVVRTLPQGIACEFVKTLPPAQLKFDIVL